MNVDHLVPIKHKERKHGNRTSNKGLRRYLRRISERKGITYKEAILKFYKIESLNKLDKDLLHSLFRV